MRTLAVGDIHGCTTAFDQLLEAIDLRPEDKLITLGDYVDKGPNSKGVLERLLFLYENHQLIPLKGNHELMMLDAFQGKRKDNFWLLTEGKTTLESYPQTNDSPLLNVPDSHWDFLKQCCLDWYETDNHIFVHANLDPHLPLHKQSNHNLFWQKLYPHHGHYSGKIVVCGHTSQKDGCPVNMGHQICIDTWACGQGWLSCLDVDTGKIWQTNQQGEVKIGHIKDFSHVSIN
ncbi:serine/threonine protein phosphatase [Crocosphaera subtropica ATCC 51142]|uniref:Serine/threonine protein phosphatase n=1 Tax=Crocosphaera subtropica (strain ATCC 51142 / BH68) TaxID=43989 RepID=B1X333_CROS5|nr:metallophosphoesterase family protein [Crocosphaera subtropica]ACB54544.1 serine/threonine protein phosphatase [Crocosphaera subtropica ATCC 51142]